MTAAVKFEPPAKERPIFFSGPMVRALLEGRKTQTRRAIRWPTWVGKESDREDWAYRFKEAPWLGWFEDGRSVKRFSCPYGQPGDRLWVRESIQCDWAEPERDWDGLKCGASYVADGAPVKLDHWGWRRSRLPSIHCPRELSRLTLDVTEVRVERLQDISEEDAKAEGAFFTDYGRRCYHPWDGPGPCPAPEGYHPRKSGWAMVATESDEQCLGSPQMAFANLWESINGADSWDANPWVWVVSFAVAPGGRAA